MPASARIAQSGRAAPARRDVAARRARTRAAPAHATKQWSGSRSTAAAVAARVVARRRSHAVLRRIHPVATAAQTGSGCVGRMRREVDRRAAFEQPREVRQPAFGGARPDVVERRAVEQRACVTRGPPATPRADQRRVVRGPRLHRHGAAAAARRQRQRQRRDHRDREQRRADPAAAPAERVVRDGDREQHDGRRAWSRSRRPSCAARPVSPSAAPKPRTLSHISVAAPPPTPPPARPAAGRSTHPGDSTSSAKNSRDDDQHVEDDREVDAVERPSVDEPPPRSCADSERHLRVQLQHEHRQIRRAERAGEQRVVQHRGGPRASRRRPARYTSLPMPVDVDAAVICEHAAVGRLQRAGARRTRDRARRATRPVRDGEAVARHRTRCCGGRSRSSKSCATPTARRAASRSSTSASAPAPACSTTSSRRARRSASVRSAGRSSRSIRRREAWMVAGGVGLAPFVTLAEALHRARHADDAVLRRAPRRRAALRRTVRAARRPTSVLTTEDGSRGVTRLHHRAARRGARRGAAPPATCSCTCADRRR